jgi:hypothetical protein
MPSFHADERTHDWYGHALDPWQSSDYAPILDVDETRLPHACVPGYDFGFHVDAYAMKTAVFHDARDHHDDHHLRHASSS